MLKDKKYIIAGIITLVLGVGIVGVKAAENRNISDLIELAKVVNESNSEVIASAIGFLNENVLGASGTRFPNGISADSTSPSAGEVRGTTITSTGAATLASGSVTGAFDGGTFTQSGGVRATSTVNSAETLLASDFDTENMIDYTLNVQDATLTLPASSTLSSFVPNAGDMRSVVIRNATTTATMDLTIAGGSGTLLKIASTTNSVYTPVITGDTDASNSAIITFIRKANTDIIAMFTMFKD